jgi:hypothetical protein
MATYGQKFGQAIGQGTQGAGDIIAQLLQLVQKVNPVNLGQSTATGILGTEVGQNPMQNIMSEVAKKTLTKRLTAHAETTPDEVLASFVAPKAESPGVSQSPPQAPESAGLNPSTMEVSPGEIPAPPESQKAQLGNILSRLLSFIATPSSSQDGVYKPGTSFGGLIQESSANALAGQQRVSLQQEPKKEALKFEREKQMELFKGQIDLEKDISKQGLKFDYDTKLEQLKSGLKGNESLAANQIFTSDLSNLVTAWDKVPIKAGTFGLGGRLGGALAGANIGSEQVAEFEAQSNALLYSAASSIAKQEGRAISDADIKRVEKTAGFKITDSEEKFNGKVQALLNLMSSRGVQGLPRTAKQFRALAKKQGKTQSEPNRVGKYTYA